MSLSCTAAATGRHRTASGRAKCPACSPRLDAPRALAAPEIFDQTVLLEDRDGSLVEVEPGVIDDAAVHVYTAGQCMALAVELARKLESDRVAMVVSWNNPRVMFEDVNPDDLTIHHMWAVSPDGIDAIDIREVVPMSHLMLAFVRDVGVDVPAARFFTTTIDEALARYELSAHQDFEAAGEFASVIAKDYAPREPIMGDMRLNPDGTRQWFLNGQWQALS